jgi:hypothetical protein
MKQVSIEVGMFWLCVISGGVTLAIAVAVLV